MRHRGKIFCPRRAGSAAAFWGAEWTPPKPGWYHVNDCVPPCLGVEPEGLPGPTGLVGIRGFAEFDARQGTELVVMNQTTLSPNPNGEGLLPIIPVFGARRYGLRS